MLTMAVAATLGISTTDAATIDVQLTGITRYYPPGANPPTATLSSSTATWQFDDTTGVLTQTGGVFDAPFTGFAATTLFRHSITGLVIGGGDAASASTFICTEGNFGSSFVAASMCGSYNFGSNVIDESSISYGPGVAYGRTIGGDDVVIDGIGATGQQNIADYDGFEMVSWDGVVLTLSNASCNTQFYGSESGCLAFPGNANSGYTWTLAPVPSPAAAWLVTPVFGLLAPWVKRRQATAKSARTKANLCFAESSSEF
jgi:hypothetical protein